MAELVLSTIGRSVGARFGSIGAALGRAGGALLGRSIDQQIFGARTRHEGARLTDLHVQASTEGASMPALYGRVRISGQVIWAACFKEHVRTRDVGGGKGGGARATSREYTYSLSFAVGLCEGEIARIGRVWANGEAFDLSQAAWRLHTGAEHQTVDPLIEAIEGVENTPAYRGLAYIVFEDLPLEAFGNSIPQLSFEVIRSPPHATASRLEERVRGVCLIPGAGEFVYATEPVLRQAGPGRQVAENLHVEAQRANVLVSLDQLAADLPNCETVMLVVAWFGDDLRCGVCQVRPGVEVADKDTVPQTWRAGGVARGGAHLVSTFDGAPAFGGTPSDASVLQAIAELKARGYKVGLYPFLLMDVPADNALADPYGAATQSAYPWRGRVTLHPAAGQPASPDKTGAATAQIAAFFGDAAPSDFGVSHGAPDYDGPAEWSYRRFVLHYAKLAGLAGGVDCFVLGSELRGLTTARDAAANYPAVDEFIELAADVRSLVGPDTKLTYAADWSEYSGHRPQDGSNDLFFHLDPLWADVNIDVVGVDWYAPLSDWRDGSAHLDAALAGAIHDPDYLRGRIEAGENFDWYYVDGAARAAQTRSSIVDAAYAEPWVFRPKDVRGFWANAHYNRPGGMRAASPTAWIPESKPVWFVELGCPAVDKGANAPNVFVDAKSAESALPFFSSGARDDLIQRRVLEAYLKHWEAEGDDNPVSSLTGKPMIEEMMIWAWDARPHPAFPARTDVWSDGASWRLGHWLNGRAGLSLLGEVVDDLCRRAGVDDADVSGLTGAVSGFVVDAPMSAREAITPLMEAFAFTAGERGGQLEFFHHDQAETIELSAADFAEAASTDLIARRADAFETPVEARVRFIDAAKDYLIAGVSARRLDRAEGGVESVDAPLVLEEEAAEAMAQRVLAERRAAAETLRIELGPAHQALEPGDRVSIDGGEAFEIHRKEEAETIALELRRVRAASGAHLGAAEPNAPPTPALAPTPVFCVLDLPLLPNAPDDDRPLAAVYASPWLGAHEIHAGAAPSLRASAPQPATIGELLWALWPGPVDRWDHGNVARIKLYGGALSSVSVSDVLAGANTFAIEADGEWEVLQARQCVLAAPDEYELRDLLRGQLGTAHAMAAPHPAGARIVLLDQNLVRVSVGAHEWGEALRFVVPPHSALATDARAATRELSLPHAAARPWAPAHLRARRDGGGDVHVSWVRCARLGDSWGAGEPPLGESAESYRLDILDGGDIVRTVETLTPAYLYTAAQQTVDFGAPPASLRVRVAQLRASGEPGLNKELTIPL